MGRHGIREDDVDRLLRGDVLVDLYGVVRQGVRASVESYSIKRLEPLYRYTREIGLRDVGPVIAAYEAWLQAGGEAGHDDAALRKIERYNHDDVVSTMLLRDWLEGRRLELATRVGAILPRPLPKSGEAADELSETLAKVQALADRLTEGFPADEKDRTPEPHARWLLAQLLSWHRREEKSFWWRYFFLIDDLTDDDRIAEREPMGGLTYVGPVGQIKKSIVHRYRFPPQEHAIREGGKVTDPATKKSPAPSWPWTRPRAPSTSAEGRRATCHTRRRSCRTTTSRPTYSVPASCGWGSGCWSTGSRPTARIAPRGISSCGARRGRARSRVPGFKGTARTRRPSPCGRPWLSTTAPCPSRVRPGPARPTRARRWCWPWSRPAARSASPPTATR
jgi:hypothetical protein